MLKMFRLVCTSLLSVICCLIMIVRAQPLSCEGDEHCTEGYFCETETNICQECLRCEDFNRRPPKLNLSECIKSLDSCGLCNEGYINMFRNGAKGKCVLPEFLEFGEGSHSHYRYVCLVAAAVGLAVVATFVYVIKQTEVFRVVAYYDPVSGNLSNSDTVPNESFGHLLKCLMQQQKDQNDKINMSCGNINQ
ncbi:uncharacterized protein LOC118263286 [Spodoptera frugiperda]|uniref:Uncharacterized protein LOC118263286 n=1 Tax=Spodoptera frugiperda TaxID=7108 RepID=A0A9R0F5T3_SPOFR|nr:uncharacterized protein LOC118263286 [Spodoptera frugiperda]XP_050561268.1 uncharacterized protein LOC118263286 [Spodoptera frugiperda]